MNFSAIPELSVFYDWLFLVFSGFSLGTAANFLLLPNVAKILKEYIVDCESWMDFFSWANLWSPLLWGKKIQKWQEVNDEKVENNIGKCRTYKIITVLSFLLFVPSPWRETYLFTGQFSVQIGKNHFVIFFTEGKIPFRPFLFSQTSFFNLSTKMHVCTPLELDNKVVLPRRHKNE